MFFSRDTLLTAYPQYIVSLHSYFLSCQETENILRVSVPNASNSVVTET